MRPNIRNLDAIRGHSDLGKLIAQAFDDLLISVDNISTQTVADPSGSVKAPPQTSSLNITAANGVFYATISDSRPVLRGIQYFLEYSNSPQFPQTATFTDHLGPSRNWSKFLGSGTFYFRAYSSYPTSAPSTPVYFGSAASPTGVAGGGTIAGPSLPTSTGSGTEPSAGFRTGAGFGFDGSRGNVRLK